MTYVMHHIDLEGVTWTTLPLWSLVSMGKGAFFLFPFEPLPDWGRATMSSETLPWEMDIAVDATTEASALICLFLSLQSGVLGVQ